MLSIAACGVETPPVQPPHVAAPKVLPRLPVDFVVCIDNSRSIKGPEQVLIRETAMLLADLADPGDRISVVAFGRDARLATEIIDIQSDEDRRVFKQQVRDRVQFRENYSDIRAGIRVLAQEESRLFRPADASIRAVILLTDGKLEPVEHDSPRAFEQIQADLSGPLSGTDVYAVVLGDTSSRHPISGLADMTGQILMREHIARSEDRYFHAKTLNQLLDIAVLIMKRTKGISNLGEEGKSQFKIDDTVESLTLIVRKRAADGTPIAETSEIFLTRPGDGESETLERLTYQNHNRTSGVSAHWSPDFQNFDLIVVRNPHQGFWEVGLMNGNTPEVQTKIVSPIELRYHAEAQYYLNESSTMEGWLFDKNAEAIWKEPYTLQARLALGGQLSDSNTYVPLQHDPTSRQFFLTVPDVLMKQLNLASEPTTVEMELIAEKLLDSQTKDPWFIRRSVPFTVQLVAPIIDWISDVPALRKIPLLALSTTLGATMSQDAVSTLDFEIPPTLTIAIEKFDDDANIYQAHPQQILKGVPHPGGLTFQADIPLIATGSYRFHYALEGNTKTGPFVISSPWSTFTVRYGWEYLGGGIAVLLLLLQILSGKTATIKGQVAVQEPSFCSETVAPVRMYHSDRLQKRCDQALGEGHSFKIEAKRFMFIRKRLRLTMTKGKASLGIIKGSRVMNSQTLQAGQKIDFVPRPHEMTFTRGDGTPVKIKISLSI